MILKHSNSTGARNKKEERWDDVQRYQRSGSAEVLAADLALGLGSPITEL